MSFDVSRSLALSLSRSLALSLSRSKLFSVLTVLACFNAATAAAAGYYVLPADDQFDSTGSMQYRVRWVHDVYDPGSGEDVETDLFISEYEYLGELPPGSGNYKYRYFGGYLFPSGGQQKKNLKGRIEKRAPGGDFVPQDGEPILYPTWVP